MTVGRSPLATSSLGAVGGARGTAAGGLRILIEFLTQYDSTAVKKLEGDLKTLSSESDAASKQELSRLNAINTATAKLAKTQDSIRKMVAKSTVGDPAAGRQARASLKEIENLGTLSKAGQAQLRLLDKQLGLRGRLVKAVTLEANLTRTQAARQRQAADAAERTALAKEAELGVSKQLSFFQNLKGSVLPRLGGLAAGAIGGVFGGALIGVGFAAAQAALDAIEQSLLDVFDPARHARDAIKDLGAEINSLADSEENAGDRTKAAIEYLKALGIAADEATVSVLAKAAASEIEIKAAEELAKVYEAIKFPEAVHNEAVKNLTRSLIEKARVEKHLRTVTIGGGRSGTHQVADEAYYAAQAERILGGAIAARDQKAKDAAASAASLAAQTRALAAAAQLAAFAEQQLVGAIQAGAAAQVAGIDSKISGLGSGVSAKTKRLQAQLERAGSGGGSNRTELANIAEERAILLLRKKLALMGTAINLEKYSGKFLLEAINAKLKALQKEAAAQARINKMLDLQYRMSQVLRRNEGETISDFLERRAQENRDQLNEQADLEREAVEAHLQELQEKTQTEVALAENAERRKTALAAGGASARNAILQKELAASQKHDAAVLEAKRAALEKQKADIIKLAQTTEEYAKAGKNAQIREAISAADTVAKLSQLSGEISGLSAAKAFIRALIATGSFSGGELKGLQDSLADINRSLAAYNQKRSLLTGHVRGKGPTEFAKGGLIPLNNASTPFGSNVRFGEEGTEYGLILQHSIAKTLRNQSRTGQVGPFYVNKSDDWLRDKYDLGRTVEEAIDKALR